eukprot:4810307-Amphidinium_carterae.1
MRRAPTRSPPRPASVTSVDKQVVPAIRIMPVVQGAPLSSSRTTLLMGWKKMVGTSLPPKGRHPRED